MMVMGTLIVAVSLLVLGFTRELVGLVVVDDEAARRPTIVLAVLAIYAVDFAINAGMSDSHVRTGLWGRLTRTSHVVLEESDCRHAPC